MTVLEKELEVSDLNFDFNKKDAVKELIKEFGQQFSISKSVREQHTDTTTIHTSKLPDGVVFAENEIDVKKTVEICQKYNVHNSFWSWIVTRRACQCFVWRHINWS